MNMLFYLINYEMWKISYMFELDRLYSEWWGKSPLRLDIFESDIPYIQMFYIALLSYTIVYM